MEADLPIEFDRSPGEKLGGVLGTLIVVGAVLAIAAFLYVRNASPVVVSSPGPPFLEVPEPPAN